jgi:phage terminase large subunit-like protein
MDQGLPGVRFGQGFASMSGACKELERLVLARQLYHTGCPVLRWCLSNVPLEQDAAGNIKITKSKSREKVDGLVGVDHGDRRRGRQTSIYEERGTFLWI